ncbi:MAG: leucine-rich repeat domain-containing protein [Acidobacteria bacterium]|nr:leucine-rich repeat domain-containing protein [Acidobacteriota bacterium]
MNRKLITQLKRGTFQDVHWRPEDKPILIADGKLFLIDDLDAPVEADSAYVAGVNQKSFERLCRFLRPAKLHFYEMRVRDVRLLAEFHGLQQLAIRWNTQLVDIAPLSHLHQLRVLVLEDTPKVVDLNPIAYCMELSALEFAGGIWNKNCASTLAPLATLPALEDLVLLNLKVLEGGLKPLAGCRHLRRLTLSNQFKTEDYAFLSAALPDVECAMFAPYLTLNQAINGKDIMIVGSRKPFLNSRDDSDKIKMYEEAFNRLKAGFASDLSL